MSTTAKSKKLKIQLLSNRVLIEPMLAESKTASGIIIPDNAKEAPVKGTIMAIGTGEKGDKMVLKIGDNVLYGKYAGSDLDFEGKPYKIMRETDVFAII